MRDCFGGYVVGFTDREKVGKVVPRLIVKVDDEDPLTAARCKSLLDDAVKLSGRALVSIEIRNLVSVQRGPLGWDTIDEKFVYSGNTHTLVTYRNGTIV